MLKKRLHLTLIQFLLKTFSVHNNNFQKFLVHPDMLKSAKTHLTAHAQNVIKARWDETERPDKVLTLFFRMIILLAKYLSILLVRQSPFHTWCKLTQDSNSTGLYIYCHLFRNVI